MNLVLSPIDPSLLISSIAEKTAVEVLRILTQREEVSKSNQWLDINELCLYHPDRPSRQTVYGWVNSRQIPVHKTGKKLRFLKSEIDEYLRQDRKPTHNEDKLGIEKYCAKKGKRG